MPPSLTQLIFKTGRFNQPLLRDTLPEGLLQLELSTDFNQPLVPNVLPEGLLQLKLSDDFNQPLAPNVLPAGLTHLTFGWGYTQPLTPDVLPVSLTHVILGCETYAHPVTPDMLLHPDLTHLTVPENFNLNIDGWAEVMDRLKSGCERPIKVNLAGVMVKVKLFVG